MEKKLSHSPHAQPAKLFSISLKDLPPIDPSIAISVSVSSSASAANVSDQLCQPRVSREKKFDEDGNKRADLLAEKVLELKMKSEAEYDSLCSVKCINQNGSMTIKNETEMNDQSSEDKAHIKNPGAGKVPPKAQLHELCAANKWEKPVFECCKEEGPDHMKLFTYKVIVEIDQERGMVLECFSGPKSKKKTAAEHAAEGALWYLKQQGYFQIKSSIT